VVTRANANAPQKPATTPKANGATANNTPRRPVLPLGPEYDVYEALIRYNVQDFAGTVRRPIVFLVALDGNDPPAEFLKRLADLKAPVWPASIAKDLAPKVMVVGITLGVVEWQGADEARVLGRVAESWVAHKCGTPWPMNASRKQGKWIVVVK
jgi:hypothetical protein